VQRPSDPKRHVPLIDLGTVRETLVYIRDDLRRVVGLEGAADLLSSAIAEVEVADRRRLTPLPRSLVDAQPLWRRAH